MKKKVFLVLGLMLLGMVLGYLFVIPSEANAPGGGTCCPQVFSTCYPDTGGKQENAYWRTDGLPCGQ